MLDRVGLADSAAAAKVLKSRDGLGEAKEDSEGFRCWRTHRAGETAVVAT
jgi:hypothetical protein